MAQGAELMARIFDLDSERARRAKPRSKMTECSQAQLDAYAQTAVGKLLGGKLEGYEYTEGGRSVLAIRRAQ
jgi:hypothetical protein